MKRFLISGVALAALSACQPAVPDDTSAGVGFRDYDAYQSQSASREAELSGRTTISGPAPVLSTPLDDDGETAAIASGTLADQQAASDARAANSGVDPVQASPANPAPTVSNEFGISTENSFEAVSSERSIESDAQRIAQSRAQYQIVQPTELPTRRGSGPNIVEYALNTSNPVGNQIYKRSRFNAENKFARSCAAYASSDQAQIAFLANGGPQKDRAGMDPDGDGYACNWDPAPFRAVRSQVPGR